MSRIEPSCEKYKIIMMCCKIIKLAKKIANFVKSTSQPYGGLNIDRKEMERM